MGEGMDTEVAPLARCLGGKAPFGIADAQIRRSTIGVQPFEGKTGRINILGASAHFQNRKLCTE